MIDRCLSRNDFPFMLAVLDCQDIDEQKVYLNKPFSFLFFVSLWYRMNLVNLNA